jgi:hypothetical protein
MLKILKNEAIIFEGDPLALSESNAKYLNIDLSEFIEIHQGDVVDIEFEEFRWHGEVFSVLKVLFPERRQTIAIKLI